MPTKKDITPDTAPTTLASWTTGRYEIVNVISLRGGAGTRCCVACGAASNGAATAYLLRYNRTGYTHVSPNATTDNTYYNVTGRVSTVYQGYMKLSTVADASVYASARMQADDVIWIVEMNTTLQ
jgi:hypothetical protein